ncbi:MAG: DNA polymerase III subunit beta [Candidatus Kapaibacteriales bacterium]
MNFKVNIGDFQKLLQKVLPVVPPKATIPVLEHLRFTLEGNNLEIVATDQDITILCNKEVVGLADGSVLVPARKISDVVKALSPAYDLEFILNPEGNVIDLKTTNGKYEMMGLASDEYLSLPELFASKKPNYDEGVTADQCKFSGEELQHLCNSTIFAVSNDEFRPMMSGVFFQFRGDSVNAVATDSYRLVKSNIKHDSTEFPNDLDVIIPSRTINLIRKFSEDIWLSFVKSDEKITHVRFDIGEVVFISRIIDEKFPSYESVIPKEFVAEAIVSKTDIAGALKRISALTNPTTKQVRFKFDSNALTVTGTDDDLGTNGRETVPAEFSGEDLEIGFNYDYVNDAISNIEPVEDGNIFISFSGQNKPFLVMPSKESETSINLIMPVRI